MAESRQQLPHLLVLSRAATDEYKPRAAFPKLRIPERNVSKHGKFLLQQFEEVSRVSAELEATRQQLGIGIKSGIQIEFESQEDSDLKIESLESRDTGIELRNVRRINNKTLATVYVPDGQIAHFIKRVEEYLTRKTSGKKPQPKNRALVACIENVRAAALDALWTDDPTLLPNHDDAVWWEVWLSNSPTAGDPEEIIRQAAQIFHFEIAEEKLEFPEHIVLALYATKKQLSQSLPVINSIAELRLAKVTADRYIELPLIDQSIKVDEILGKTNFTDSNVAVCMLDTGVNHGHPLVEPAIQPQHAYACKDEWGADDHNGHGTEMAGLAIYGDLIDVIGVESHEVEHALESVKIIPPRGANPPHLYGRITQDSVRKIEAALPGRQRVISMQITADDRDRGKPSTWSAALDSLTSGSQDEIRRLFMVSGGNTQRDKWHTYPNNCLNESVEDPGQSWNALTVGAYTEKTNTTSKDYSAWKVVASSGGLSPYSRTSCSWDHTWPVKPEIVFEGGNCAIDPSDALAYEIDPLSLLTTNRDIGSRLFTASCMTSAATAVAARFAARLMARYPKFLPETVRALMVHSADWTEAMTAPFAPIKTKADKEKVLRYCGYGVPNFERACWSASNELTLIAQDEIQPYDKVDGVYKTRYINFHKLPWPSEQLRQIGPTDVELRVTLSYFIEPNPGERGWKGRYRYASHALRFDVRKAGELEADFKKRINRAARAEEEIDGDFGATESNWKFGYQARHRGSIHSDSWTGTAAELVDHDLIAVYPVVGWWRERTHHGRWNRKARYSLIVSIFTPSTEIDIYTLVKNKIEVEIPIDIDRDEEQ